MRNGHPRIAASRAAQRTAAVPVVVPSVATVMRPMIVSLLVCQRLYGTAQQRPAPESKVPRRSGHLPRPGWHALLVPRDVRTDGTLRLHPLRRLTHQRRSLGDDRLPRLLEELVTAAELGGEVM